MSAERQEPRFKLGLYIYNRNEDGGPWWTTAQWALWPTVFGKYLSTIAKGWWKLGWGEINRHFEVEFAIGGEDNMAQFGIVVPFLFRWTFGVRLPRKLTKGWIYDRRSWALRVGYIGRWFEVLIARDEQLAEMASYYRACRQRGEELVWSRAALWPGIHLTFHPRPLDWVLGRKQQCVTTKGEPQPVTIPMPEGNYPGTMVREERTWKRKRSPWIAQRRTDYWVEIPDGIPTPGKGENSYDCCDDAIFGTGGSSPAVAIANVTKAALRQREKYGSKNWEPEGGWPTKRTKSGVPV
jgi:hypothetical protein